MKIPTHPPFPLSARANQDPAQAAENLEAYFLRHVLKEARVGQTPAGASSFTADTFAELLQGALADQLSEHGGIGLARALLKQLGPAEGLDTYPAYTDRLPVMPVDGSVTSRFGHRRDPIASGVRHHKGIDIAAPHGTTVRSAGEGVVTFAGSRGNYGRLVIVDHGDGLETRYAHLSETQVRLGEHIAAGTTVGFVGTTGRTTGPHLHFEVRRHDAPIDPIEAVAGLNESKRRSKQ